MIRNLECVGSFRFACRYLVHGKYRPTQVELEDASTMASIAGITTQHGLWGCITSFSSARVQFRPCFHRASRGYAAVSASLTKKTPVTAKGTRKDARTQPQPPPRKAASRTPKKTTSSEMETAATDTVAVENSKVQGLNPLNMTEEQTKELDRMMVMAQFMPTMDPWGQEVLDTLGGSLRLLSHLFIF